MNVVVVDSANLAGDADFPMIDVDKFGWQQFPLLDADEVAERCWRSDIIVSTAMPIDKQVIDQAFKLQLIVAAGNSVDHIDLDAARERDILVCNVPGADPQDATQIEMICNEVVANINAFIKQQARNLVIKD